MLTMASTRTCTRGQSGSWRAVQHRTHLDGVLVGEEVDDLKRVRDNADGQELLAVVAALHHHAIDLRNAI